MSRLRSWRKRIKIDIDQAVDEVSMIEPQATDKDQTSAQPLTDSKAKEEPQAAVEDQISAQPPTDSKARKSKKAMERDAERIRKLNMTEEEKAEEKQRREAELAIKLELKCTHAIALLATLRERLSAASTDLPIIITALDVEAWEQEGDKVTEVGLAIAHLSFVDSSPIQTLESSIFFRHRHMLIREHLAMYNGRHVANNKDYFLFGDSEVFTLADAVKELTSELNSADFIVGHAVSGDLEWLRKIGVSGLEANSLSLQTRLVDTQTLAFSIQGVTLSTQPPLGLKAMADGFGLDPDRLHNGANDAAFTLQVMLSQCGVVFPIPKRTMSKHQSMPEFQTALLESTMRLSGSQREWLLREQQLRSDVEMFAQSLRADSTAAGEPDHLKIPNVTPQVLQFPDDLTPKERRVVHEAAESLGLQSHSHENGPNGKRCVSVARPGALNVTDAVTTPSAREPKRARKKDSVGRGCGRGSAICFDFRDKGSCKFGDDCQFSHGM